MRYFLCKLIPPRPTFPGDMTPAEAAIMQSHAAHCRALLDSDRAVVFGPVNDPSGVWGLGILQLPDDVDPQTIIADDPAMRANAGFRYEVLPMLAASTRGV